jgi:beta-glucanase (GH16 family)
MDVMENVGDPTWINSALHGPGYSGATPFTRRRPFPAEADATAWHVYGMEWRPDGFAFSVDGEVYYEPTRAMVEAHGPWAYDSPKFLILNFALGGQYPQAVNRVTAPYPGLPGATVEDIKAGRVRMLVDWVRVTRR